MKELSKTLKFLRRGVGVKFELGRDGRYHVPSGRSYCTLEEAKFAWKRGIVNAIESYNEGVNVCHFKHEELKGEKVKQLPKAPTIGVESELCCGRRGDGVFIERVECKFFVSKESMKEEVKTLLPRFLSWEESEFVVTDPWEG